MTSAKLVIATALFAQLSLISLSAFAQTTPTRAGVAFANLGGRDLLLDYYAPNAGTGTGPRPLVVWLHDGGWLSGSRALPAFVAPLRARGIAIASIDYRLTTEAGLYGTNGVTFPAQIHDVKGAIRYLRANAAEFNIDPARIGAWGSSSGGHLAALAATSGNSPDLEGSVGGNTAISSRLLAAVDYYGPTDLLQLTTDVTTPPGSIVDHDGTGAPGSLLLGFTAAGQGVGVLRANANNANAPFPFFIALARSASPLSFVDALDPPIYIVHGTADPQVAIRQSERLRDALTSAGANPSYVAVPGGGHGGFATSVHDGAINFLVEKLTAPPSFDITAAMTGAWYDPAQSGHGLFFEVLPEQRFLAWWFTFDPDGKQAWFGGVGTYSGNRATLTALRTQGGRFIPNFNPANVSSPTWGTLTFTFSSCNSGLVEFSSDVGFGTGSMPLTRLTLPLGLSCP